MLAEKLISDSLTSVNSTEKGKVALNAMDVYRVSHIPVVNGTKYLGLVSDKLIYDLNLLEVPIETQLDKLNTSHVHHDQHIFEIAILMYKLKLSVLAVLGPDHQYLGSITLYDLARRFARLFSLEETGGVIILEMNINNYSLAEISRIVESCDIKILSCFTDRKHGTNIMDVILKLNKDDLSILNEAFMRYDYNVKAVYLDQSEFGDLYKDRFDLFMKFMNI